MIDRPLISVICCAHNEEKYVERSMPHLIKALKGFSYEIIFVADRCTDSTVEKVRKYGAKLIEKDWKSWMNGYAECLQTGYLNSRGKYIGIVDVDVVVPATLFRTLMPVLKNRIASVDARIVTLPDTFWNRWRYAWEKTYDVAPLGRGHHGAARVIVKKVLDEILGFRDVFSVDTDVDLRLAERGYKSLTVSSVKVYHIRHISLKSMVKGQIRMGRGRYMIGYSFMKTVGHAIFRFRPFLLGGWFMEWVRRKDN